MNNHPDKFILTSFFFNVYNITIWYKNDLCQERWQGADVIGVETPLLALGYVISYTWPCYDRA